MPSNSRLSAAEHARAIAAIVLSLGFLAAGSAMAKNHDAQRVDRQAAHAPRHDRAAGPLEASNTVDRQAD